MITFIDLLRSRRSIREFTGESVAQDKIDIIKEAALRSPSSRGIDPWEFVFVQDKTLLKKLAKCKPHGAEFIADAALAVVVLADTSKTDVWVEDCSIAAILIQLAAHDLELGTCWVQVRNRKTDGTQTSEDYVRGLLGLAPSKAVECIIAIGHPAEHPEPKPAAELDYSKIQWI
jgi:nitroreductase